MRRLMHRALLIACAISLLPVQSAFAVNRLTSVSFSDALNGYVGGWTLRGANDHDGIIARTTNGGATFWPTKITDTVLYSAGAGSTGAITAGPGDRAFLSADGDEWVERGPLAGSINTNVNAVAMLANGRAVTAGQIEETPRGSLAFIRTTDDGGATWQSRYLGPYYPVVDPDVDPEPSRTRSDFSSIDAAPGGQTAWAVGAQYRERVTNGSVVNGTYDWQGVLMQRSTDGGSTWTTQTVPGTAASPLKAVAAGSATHAFAAGMDTEFVRTTNGGATWTRSPLPGDFSERGIENYMDALALDAYGENLVVAAGIGGKIAWSTNPTAATPSWKFHNVPTRRTLRGVSILDANHWVVVGDEETILRTADGGNSWSGPTSSQPPVASITGPGAGFALTSKPVTIAGTSSDAGIGVARVDVRIRRNDGYCLTSFGTWTSADTWIPAQSSDHWATWSYTWNNPVASSNGQMVTVTARATDALELSATSTGVSSGLPLAASVTLDSGAQYTSNPNVQAAISAPGATFMRYSIDGGASSAWMPYATTKQVVLTGGDGTKNVSFEFSTDPGPSPVNIAATATDSIVLHTSAPQVAISTPVTGFALGGAVTVAGTASEPGVGVASVGVRIRRGDGLNWNGSAWVAKDTWLPASTSNAYANWSGSWTPSGSGQMLTVTAKATDAMGLTAETAAVNSAPPGTSSVVLAGGDTYTTTTTVNATLAAPGAPYWKYRLNGGALSPTWQSYSSNASLVLPGGDGTKTVEVVFSADQQNVDATVSDTIVLHTSVPTVSMTVPAPMFSLVDGKVSIAGTASDVGGAVAAVEVLVRRTDGKTWNGSAWSSSDSWLLAQTSNGYQSWTASWTPDAATIDGHMAVFVAARATDAAGLARTTDFLGSGPVITAGVTIADGAEYAISPTARVDVSTDGAAYMRYRVDGSQPSTWVPASNTTTVTLGADDGTKTVAFEFSADGSTVHGRAQDTIILDSTAPGVDMTSPAAGFDYRTETVTIGGVASDALSGLADVKLRIQQGNFYWAGVEGGWQGTEQWVDASTADGFENWNYTWHPDSASRGSGQPVTVTVRAFDAAGNQTAESVKSIDPADPALVTLTSPASAVAAYGAKASVKGSLKVEGAPYDGTVVLQAGSSAAGLKDTAYRAKADLAGNFSFAVPLSAKTYYRVRYLNPPSHAAASSGIISVTPKVYLSTPSTPSSARRNTKFYTYGSLKPRHSSGSYAVKFYCYRYERGTYKLRKTVSIKVKNYSSYSRYYGYLSLPYSGKWRIRAYHGDSAHAATYSSYRYITIK